MKDAGGLSEAQQMAIDAYVRDLMSAIIASHNELAGRVGDLVLAHNNAVMGLTHVEKALLIVRQEMEDLARAVGAEFVVDEPKAKEKKREKPALMLVSSTSD